MECKYQGYWVEKVLYSTIVKVFEISSASSGGGTGYVPFLKSQSDLHKDQFVVSENR